LGAPGKPGEQVEKEATSLQGPLPQAFTPATLIL